MSARLSIAALVMIAVVRTTSAQPTTPPSQPPPPTATCDILEISASTGDKPAVDPQLDKLKKKFKKPPFSSWNVFKLLMRSDKTLAMRKSESIKLTHGAATVTFNGVVNKSQVRLNVSIDDDKGKNIVNNSATIEAGDYLVYGHSLPNNDGHLLALSCK